LCVECAAQPPASRGKPAAVLAHQQARGSVVVKSGQVVLVRAWWLSTPGQGVWLLDPGQQASRTSQEICAGLPSPSHTLFITKTQHTHPAAGSVRIHTSRSSISQSFLSKSVFEAPVAVPLTLAVKAPGSPEPSLPFSRSRPSTLPAPLLPLCTESRLRRLALIHTRRPTPLAESEIQRPSHCTPPHLAPRRLTTAIPPDVF